MADRNVFCVKLKKELPGLEEPVGGIDWRWLPLHTLSQASARREHDQEGEANPGRFHCADSRAGGRRGGQSVSARA